MDRDLLLAEELLLLSLDEKGSDQTWLSVDGGLAGALLLELTEDGALRLDEDDKLAPGGAVPADPLLVEALEAVRSADKPRDAKHWVSKLSGELKPLRRRLAERLVELGILGEDRKELLGLTVSRRYPERDPEPERALRARLLAILTGEAEPAPRDAELIGLLRPFDLVAKNVPREHRREAKRRAKEIAETGPVNSAVSREVADVQIAIMAGTAAAVFVDGGGGGGDGGG